MYLTRTALATRQFPNLLQRRFKHTPQSQGPSDDSNISSVLTTPSWSVASLLSASSLSSSSSSNITRTQLHHFLRLSALPLPSSEAEERKMIGDLESQLRFVRAIQEVDTEGVEPLKAIRDETREAEREGEIGVEELRKDFEREEVVGRRRRIRNKTENKVMTQNAEEKGDAQSGTEGWNLLRQAPKRMGRFVVVETRKD